MKIRALIVIRIALSLQSLPTKDKRPLRHPYPTFKTLAKGSWRSYGLEAIVGQLCRVTPHHAALWRHGESLNEKMWGRSPFPRCFQMKIGWHSPFDTVRHPPTVLHYGYTDRVHPTIKYDPLVKDRWWQTTWAMNMPVGYSRGRTSAPSRLNDLDHQMWSPWWRSMVDADVENEIARSIKSKENLVRISLRLRVRWWVEAENGAGLNMPLHSKHRIALDH